MIDNPGIVAFNLSYIGILFLVIIFLTRRTSIRENFPPKWIYLAFIALVIGDTVHILSRVIVYFAGITSGNLEVIYAQEWAISLLGIGLGATSITIHLFYFLIYIYWRKCEAFRWSANQVGEKEITPRHVRALDVVAALTVISRVVLVLFPENQWGLSSTVPNVVRYITNIPLYIMGVLTIVLLLRQSLVKDADAIPGFAPRERKMSGDIAYWMIISFGMYSLTVFLTWVSPLFGMAMLPKTLAYLAMFYAFVKGYFMKGKPEIIFESKTLGGQMIPKPALESA